MKKRNMQKLSKRTISESIVNELFSTIINLEAVNHPNLKGEMANLWIACEKRAGQVIPYVEMYIIDTKETMIMYRISFIEETLQ